MDIQPDPVAPETHLILRVHTCPQFFGRLLEMLPHDAGQTAVYCPQFGGWRMDRPTYTDIRTRLIQASSLLDLNGGHVGGMASDAGAPESTPLLIGEPLWVPPPSFARRVDPAPPLGSSDCATQTDGEGEDGEGNRGAVQATQTESVHVAASTVVTVDTPDPLPWPGPEVDAMETQRRRRTGRTASSSVPSGTARITLHRCRPRSSFHRDDGLSIATCNPAPPTSIASVNVGWRHWTP